MGTSVTNGERIAELVHQYALLIAGSHHKYRDGYFAIERSWNAYDLNQEPITKYIAVHPGYLNRLEAKERYTEEAAEKDLIKFLEEIIESWSGDEEAWLQ